MKTLLDILLVHLPKVQLSHSYKTNEYQLIQNISDSYIQSSDLKKQGKGFIQSELFGDIFLPYKEMGAINTLHLFGLDELIIFSYYLINKGRYNKVADIGANIGLHSILLSKCGYQVTAYEPDPKHIITLTENLNHNNIDSVSVEQAAISDRRGSASFTRVLGNTTSSHLTGDKKPYGKIEVFEVALLDIRNIMKQHDFIKMDVEGHEAQIIEATTNEDWTTTEMILEIGSAETAKRIFNHSINININIFSQKKGWDLARNLDDLPVSYKEGSVFLTKKKMRWE